MQHRGQRSLESIELREAKRICYRTAYRDRILKETVCKQNHDELMHELAALIEGISMSEVPDVFPGVVLLDTHGTGAFDQT
jgi:hypothetical protein